MPTRDDAVDKPAARESVPAGGGADGADASGQGGAGFEESFARLEELVAGLEGGELPLEEMLDRFEEGVKLVRHCQQFLKQAQLRVEQYVEQKDGRWVLKELDGE